MAERSVKTDLDNVLQIPAVFLSVSKGQNAPAQDLAKSFGPKTSINDIILEILNKGELQVGEKERNAQLERVHNEVIDIVAGKVVDPRTRRVYTTGMIEKALAELSSQGSHGQQEGKGTPAASGTSTPNHGEPASANGEMKGKHKEMPTWTGVVTTRSPKSQALDAMKALIANQPIPVSRARMKLKITCATSILKQAVKSAPKSKSGDGAEDGAEEKVKGTVKDRLLGFVEQVQSQDVVAEEWEVIGFVEPGAFKGLSEFIGGETRGKGHVEVLDMAVFHEGD
ncbi:MAG: hypothetical protein M1837_005357 [Sclerophora amabilis]|nr:MAG: hypothetical protein M1837_005357 [Sclerophora amabilis]